MKRVGWLFLLVVSFVFVWAYAAHSQPRGDERSPAQRARMMVRGQLPLEQVLGFLALDGGVSVADDQLVKIRGVLKELATKRDEYVKKVAQEMSGAEDRQAMMERMRGMREDVQGLRTEMVERVKGVLDASQSKKLDKYLEQMRRTGRGAREGRRRDQGGRGGR